MYAACFAHRSRCRRRTSLVRPGTRLCIDRSRCRVPVLLGTRARIAAAARTRPCPRERSCSRCNHWTVYTRCCTEPGKSHCNSLRRQHRSSGTPSSRSRRPPLRSYCNQGQDHPGSIDSWEGTPHCRSGAIPNSRCPWASSPRRGQGTSAHSDSTVAEQRTSHRGRSALPVRSRSPLAGMNRRNRCAPPGNNRHSDRRCTHPDSTFRRPPCTRWGRTSQASAPHPSAALVCRACSCACACVSWASCPRPAPCPVACGRHAACRASSPLHRRLRSSRAARSRHRARLQP